MYDVSTLVHGDLLLMICTAVPNELKKEAWIKDDTLLYHDIKLKDDTSVINPTFLLKSQDSIWKYNYLYFQNTKRFYFISNIRPVLGGCFELECKVDVLMSFQKSIMNCGGFENRASDIGTGYVYDDKIVFNSAPKAKIFEFEEGKGDGQNFNGLSYVLGTANNGQYLSNTDAGVSSDKPDLAAWLNQSQQEYKDAQILFLDAVLWFLYNKWQYSKTNRALDNYCDCSSLIYKALKAAFPNIPFGQEDLTGWTCPSQPTTRDLGRFLYNCSNKKVGVWEGEGAVRTFNAVKCGRQACTSNLYTANKCVIGFNSADVENYPDSAAGWPATTADPNNEAYDPNVLRNLGIPEERLAKCGYGHVYVYVGKMGWKRSDKTYHQWDEATMKNNPDYIDMGDDWIVHTAGGGSTKYQLWDEEKEQLAEPGTPCPNYPFVCKQYDNGRAGGFFIPVYKDFYDKWG